MRASLVLILTCLLCATSRSAADPPPCAPTPAGLVSWWRAEGNANDNTGSNNGAVVNGAGFITGETGEAFILNGVNQYVLVNPHPTLDVGSGTGFSVEGWINPNTLNAQMPVFEFERILGSYNASDVGIQWFINSPPGAGTGPGCFYVNLLDTSNVNHTFNTAPGLLTAGIWQHVALTYDKPSGLAAIYLNGVVVTQVNLGTFSAQTSFTNFLIGARTYYGSAAAPSASFSGGIDELSVYARALSGSEIQSLYAAGSAGVCLQQLAVRLTVSRAPDGTMRLQGQGAPEGLYTVQASTNLLNWEQIGVATNGATSIEFDDTNTLFLPVRFYRIVSP